MQTASNLDIDITRWWDGIDDELATLDAAPELTHDPLRSNDIFDTYWVRMTSLGRYVIAAWLNIPKGDGPFPGILYTPPHMSVVTPAPYEFRTRAVTMNVITRGQRGADKPYAAAYPGHLTLGIEDPDSYIYRGVVADTIRAWEVLGSLPQVDTSRMAMIGNELALLVNARRPGAKSIHVNAGFWYRTLDLAVSTDLYPMEEINDHLRTWPESRQAVTRTLAHLDPVHQAERITANVLFHRDQALTSLNDAWYAPLASKMATPPDFLDITHLGQVDYDAADEWLSAQLDIQPFPRSWTPQDIGPWSV